MRKTYALDLLRDSRTLPAMLPVAKPEPITLRYADAPFAVDAIRRADRKRTA